jgi:hypothetical protein
MYALYCCLRFWQEDESKFLVRAGFAIGLAIGTNLTMLFPSIALIGVLTLRYIRQWWRIVDRMLLPLVVTGFIILIVPLTHVAASNFYVGVKTLAETVQTIMTASFGVKSTLLERLQERIVAYAVPLVAMVLVFCLITLKWRDRTLFAAFAVFAMVMTEILMAHYVAGLLYPYRRTGLYLVPIFTLIWLLAIRSLGRWPRWQWLAAVPLVVCLVLFVMQANVNTYDEWAFCASSKKVATLLNQDGARRVGVSWTLEPSLNYYRERLRISGMQPITRDPLDGDYDHFVLLPDDHGIVQKRGLKVVFKDEQSGVLLAVPIAR